MSASSKQVLSCQTLKQTDQAVAGSSESRSVGESMVPGLCSWIYNVKTVQESKFMLWSKMHDTGYFSLGKVFRRSLVFLKFFALYSISHLSVFHVSSAILFSFCFSPLIHKIVRGGERNQQYSSIRLSRPCPQNLSSSALGSGSKSFKG